MSTESPATSAKRGPRPRFTRDEVIRTALRLIDTCEAGTFSMRLLAEELGVGVMTLYGYVSNKEDLYEAVTVLAFGEAPVNDPDPDRPWDEEVRAAALELFGICRRHPNLVAIVLADSDPNPGLYRRRERMLAALRSAGFPAQQALHALGVLTAYVLGFAMAQGSAIRRLPESLPREHDVFPALSEAADNYNSNLGPAAFEYGLELILRSLRTDLAS